MRKSTTAGTVLVVIATVIYLQRPDDFPPGSPAGDGKSTEEKMVAHKKNGGSSAAQSEGLPDEVQPEITRSGEIPILGQKVRLREIRAGGELVNLEFVIRRGVLPRRLFAGGGRRILRFDELYRNSVGYGAATVWLLYQLQSERGVDVAVSRPDGSDFQVLARDLEKVLGFEHFPAENRVRLELEEGGSSVVHDYALPSG